MNHQFVLSLILLTSIFASVTLFFGTKINLCLSEFTRMFKSIDRSALALFTSSGFPRFRRNFEFWLKVGRRAPRVSRSSLTSKTIGGRRSSRGTSYDTRDPARLKYQDQLPKSSPIGILESSANKTRNKTNLLRKPDSGSNRTESRSVGSSIR